MLYVLPSTCFQLINTRVGGYLECTQTQPSTDADNRQMLAGDHTDQHSLVK